MPTCETTAQPRRQDIHNNLWIFHTGFPAPPLFFLVVLPYRYRYLNTMLFSFWGLWKKYIVLHIVFITFSCKVLVFIYIVMNSYSPMAFHSCLMCHCTNVPEFIYSVDEHLHYSQFFAVMNNAAKTVYGPSLLVCRGAYWETAKFSHFWPHHTAMSV